MTEIAEIESAIQKLPHREIRQLMARVDQYLELKETQAAATENFVYHPEAKPIWEVAAEIAAKIPDEEWEKVPTDLAENFDYYQQQWRQQEET